MESILGREDQRRLAALWGGILVPPIAWSLHLLVSYFIVSVACLGSWPLLVLDLLLHGLTFALGAVTVGSAVIAWRARQTEDEPGGTLPEARERRAFMVHVGVALAGLFLLLIIAGDIPNFFVPPCAASQ
ncbi:MAG TPA: hypothetical protein VFE37_26840 [Chloroflexota bacterium]|nr:hypothetical protein [Chloroflexota bacterium]